MNYQTNLKAWSIGEAINAKKAGVDTGVTLEELLASAEKIAEAAYKADSDLDDAIKRIGKIFQENPHEALDKIEQLQAELGIIAEQIEHQARSHVANDTQETVQ